MILKSEAFTGANSWGEASKHLDIKPMRSRWS